MVYFWKIFFFPPVIKTLILFQLNDTLKHCITQFAAFLSKILSHVHTCTCVFCKVNAVSSKYKVHGVLRLSFCLFIAIWTCIWRSHTLPIFRIVFLKNMSSSLLQIAPLLLQLQPCLLSRRLCCCKDNLNTLQVKLSDTYIMKGGIGWRFCSKVCVFQCKPFGSFTFYIDLVFLCLRQQSRQRHYVFRLSVHPSVPPSVCLCVCPSVMGFRSCNNLRTAKGI